MLHNPGVAKRFRPLPNEERTLSPRDQELAILRTAWLSRVPFIWGEHVRIAKEVGITPEEIERVTVGSTAPGWSEHDRAVLRTAEELRTEGAISDETWAVLAKTLDYGRLIELPALIGQYQALGYLQNALKAPLWPGNPGLSAR
jgi:alkylhydroperoxidase family enzyme